MVDYIKIGKYTYGLREQNVQWTDKSYDYDNNYRQPELNVGKYCSIGMHSKIFLGGNRRHDWITTFPFQVKRKHNSTFKSIPEHIEGYPHSNGDVNIGNDVWFGENVTVMSGVKICDGAVIAANSTVVKDVEPYSISGGNPAKHIKYRFSEEIIKRLLEIKWWDIEESKLDKLLPYMMNNDIDLFFKKYEELI
jgi:acetyltransferase-like isoleucine patch superfamily enzyme